MALQILVHGKIAASLAFTRLQLQHFEQALITTSGQVAFFLIPSHDVEHRVLGHADLSNIKSESDPILRDAALSTYFLAKISVHIC
jgi:hypothetical protein